MSGTSERGKGLADELWNSPWPSAETMSLIHALVAHESSGCPDPGKCECKGKWPWVPEHVRERLPEQVRANIPEVEPPDSVAQERTASGVGEAMSEFYTGPFCLIETDEEVAERWRRIASLGAPYRTWDSWGEEE